MWLLGWHSVECIPQLRPNTLLRKPHLVAGPSSIRFVTPLSPVPTIYISPSICAEYLECLLCGYCVHHASPCLTLSSQRFWREECRSSTTSTWVMAPGSSGKTSSGTAALPLTSSTTEREVIVGMALFPKSQFIFPDCLFLHSPSLPSILGPCHKSCGDYCWGPNKDQCQICEWPIVLCPFIHLTRPLTPPHPSLRNTQRQGGRAHTRTLRHNTHTHTHTLVTPVQAMSPVFQWLRRCALPSVTAAVLGRAPGTAATSSVQRDVKALWTSTAL